jgi:trehalose 6-phosphate phosphatase
MFASQPAGLFTDFDGTLSPVAPTPDTAVAAPGVPQTLEELTRHIALVGIVTGRGVDDAMSRIVAPDLLYVGNHGLEWFENDEHHVHPAGLEAESGLPDALRDIEQRLKARISTEGAIFENKRYSGSIHYRLTQEPGKTGEILDEIVRDVAAEYGFWASSGKMVIELRPGAEVNKGSAVRRIVTERNLGSAAFLGDDVTDADAFVVLKELRAERGIKTCSVGVLTLDTDQRVIDNSDYLLDGVDEVVAMLLELTKRLPVDTAESGGLNS